MVTASTRRRTARCTGLSIRTIRSLRGRGTRFRIIIARTGGGIAKALIRGTVCICRTAPARAKVALRRAGGRAEIIARRAIVVADGPCPVGILTREASIRVGFPHRDRGKGHTRRGILVDRKTDCSLR